MRTEVLMERKLGLGVFCDLTPYSLVNDLELVASIFRVHEVQNTWARLFCFLSLQAIIREFMTCCWVTEASDLSKLHLNIIPASIPKCLKCSYPAMFSNDLLALLIQLSIDLSRFHIKTIPYELFYAMCLVNTKTHVLHV